MKIYNEEYANLIEDLVKRWFQEEELNRDKPQVGKDSGDEDVCGTQDE